MSAFQDTVDTLQLITLLRRVPKALSSVTVLEAAFLRANWTTITRLLSGKGLRLCIIDGMLTILDAEAAPVDCAALLEAVTLASMPDVQGFAKAALSTVCAALKTLCTWLPAEYIDAIHLEPIMSSEGGFMVDAEITPQAAGTLILWPNPVNFTAEHCAGLKDHVVPVGSIPSPHHLAWRAIACTPSDISHEVVHCLQSWAKQDHTTGGEGSEWSAEHDASVAACNIMTSCAFVENLPLTSILYQLDELVAHHDAVFPPGVESRYQEWITCCGLSPRPPLDAWGGAPADLVKFRAALEAWPLDVASQLQALIQRRTGDVRAQAAPDVAIAGAHKDYRSLTLPLDPVALRDLVDSLQ